MYEMYKNSKKYLKTKKVEGEKAEVEGAGCRERRRRRGK